MDIHTQTHTHTHTHTYIHWCVDKMKCLLPRIVMMCVYVCMCVASLLVSLEMFPVMYKQTNKHDSLHRVQAQRGLYTSTWKCSHCFTTASIICLFVCAWSDIHKHTHINTHTNTHINTHTYIHTVSASSWEAAVCCHQNGTVVGVVSWKSECLVSYNMTFHYSTCTHKHTRPLSLSLSQPTF